MRLRLIKSLFATSSDYQMEKTPSHEGAQLGKKADPISLANIWAEGSTATAWAKAHGFSLPLVYKVLRGERKCLRGQSHKIAQELGMK